MKIQQFSILSCSIPIFATLFCTFLLIGKLIQVNLSNLKKLFITGIAFISVLGTFHLIQLTLDTSSQNFVTKGIFLLSCLSVILNFFIIFLTGKPQKEGKKIIYVFLISWILILFIDMGYKNFDSKFFIQFLNPSKLELNLALIIILFNQYWSLKYITKFGKIIPKISIISSDYSVQWLLNSIFMLTGISIMYFFLALAVPQKTSTYCMGLIFLNVISFILCITFCYKLFTTSHLIPSFKNLNTNKKINSNEFINKEKFEKYLKEHKPFLNSNIKLSDFTEYMGTNRTYFSLFINENYGMNFNLFINSLRLEEFEQLKLSPNYKAIPEEELVYTAGFKSYKSYQKTLENLNALKVLP